MLSLIIGTQESVNYADCVHTQVANMQDIIVHCKGDPDVDESRENAHDQLCLHICFIYVHRCRSALVCEEPQFLCMFDCNQYHALCKLDKITMPYQHLAM
jgi:hypothetical protein